MNLFQEGIISANSPEVVLVRAVSTLSLDVLDGQSGASLLQVVYPRHRLHSLTELDIDEKNLDFAKRNILANGLQSRIRPILTKPDEPFIPLDKLNLERRVSI